MRTKDQWARRLWHLLEPIHAVAYFSVESLEALKVAGYRGFWMGYFAGRAAPLGPVDADVVLPLFYNFSREHIARSLPSAWDFAPPAAAVAARQEGSVLALRRHLAHAHAAEPSLETAELLQAVASHADPRGRGLFSAYRRLLWPEETLGRVWHAATLLREHRGDGHLAALAAFGLDGREAIVLHALDVGTPVEHYRVARSFEPDEWQTTSERLQRRGLVGGDGLTADGAALRTAIEARTDQQAATALARVSEIELALIETALAPLARAVVASGDIPRLSVLGIDLADTLRE